MRRLTFTRVKVPGAYLPAHMHTHTHGPSCIQVQPRCPGRRVDGSSPGVERLWPRPCVTRALPTGDVLSSRNPARRHPGRHPSQQDPQPRKQAQASKIWVRRTKFWATSWRPLAPVVLAERWHEQPQGSGDEAAGRRPAGRVGRAPSLAGSRKGAGRRLLPASSEIDCRPLLPTLSH